MEPKKKGRRCLRLSRFKVGGSFSSESQRGAACPSVMIGFRFPRLLGIDGRKTFQLAIGCDAGRLQGVALFSSAAPPSPPGTGPFIRLLSGQKRKPATVSEPFSVHHGLTGYQGDLNDAMSPAKEFGRRERERNTRSTYLLPSRLICDFVWPTGRQWTARTSALVRQLPRSRTNERRDGATTLLLAAARKNIQTVKERRTLLAMVECNGRWPYLTARTTDQKVFELKQLLSSFSPAVRLSHCRKAAISLPLIHKSPTANSFR
jgi:hypothetical protein